jgi:hypothetical protein
MRGMFERHEFAAQRDSRHALSIILFALDGWAPIRGKITIIA